MRETSMEQAVGHVVLELTQLPEEDVSLVAEFVTYLKGQRQAMPQNRKSASEIVAEARRQASMLNDVPRAQVVTQFESLVEQIRRQAIAQGTAFEGDWNGD
jgi:hypothetical protein